MARHVKDWKVETEGRDKGKIFRLTEMTSSRGEKWAYRALLALAGGSAQLPEGFESTGWAGLAQVGFKGLMSLPWPLLEPLLDEMMECVQIVPDPKNLSFARDLEPEGGQGDYDIEEITTRPALRMEIFKLHVDFSGAAIQSLRDRIKGIMAAGKESVTATESRK